MASKKDRPTEGQDLQARTASAVRATGFWGDWEVRLGLASRRPSAKVESVGLDEEGKVVVVLDLTLRKDWLTKVYNRGIAVVEYDEVKYFCLAAEACSPHRVPAGADGAWGVMVVTGRNQGVGTAPWKRIPTIRVLSPYLLSWVVTYGGRCWLDVSLDSAMSQAFRGLNEELNYPAGPPF